MNVLSVLPPMLLGAATAFAAPAHAQDSTGLADRIQAMQDQLATEKRVQSWGNVDFGKGDDEGNVIFLKPSECDALGGDVDYHKWCEPMRLKCTIGNRAICIDELDAISG